MIEILLSKLKHNKELKKERKFERYLDNLTELYKEMEKSLDKELTYINFGWLSDMPDIAKKFGFKVYYCEHRELGGSITITKRGIKNITKEMIKYDLLGSDKE